MARVRMTSKNKENGNVRRKSAPVNDPQWYKDAVIYELHVRAFRDGNRDGIGDFRGLISTLDYLQNLGVTALWLLPFFPSPLRDDGYDIADYTDVHPDYGTIGDFKAFLKAAHARGIRVIIELVLNHTSNEHRWFQRARRAKPGTSARNFYVWSDTPQRYEDARIIFKDFESSNWAWDPVAQAYYWHRFYSHQPDLNYENRAVRAQMLKVLDFWFDLGVDGVRLDAVPYLYEQEDTNCENLPKTHDFIRQLREHVDAKYPNRMLLAEANQWPEDAVAYFGAGDECHMAFHFPLMPRLFMAVQMEDSFPIADILRSTPPIPSTCQWAMFLRNHDELTLEMVTDEERDYMNRAYAQDSRMKINVGIRRRLAPLLGNNRRKMEIMNIMLFSFPGTPVLYYGDEIGMGDNHYLGDRNGVRTPMQWTGDKNAGFSDVNPQRLYLPAIIDPQYHYEAVNVEVQEENLSSMLWWMKRVIAMRKRYRCLSRGELEFIESDNSKVLAFTRSYEDERMLIVINLSRFTQSVTFDLSHLAGYVPEETFSRNPLPVIPRKPYSLAVGPYGHFWLLLRQRKGEAVRLNGEIKLTVDGAWEGVLAGRAREELLAKILPSYLLRCRWYGGKGRPIRDIAIAEDVVVGKEPSTHMLIIRVSYRAGSEERYLLPLSFAQDSERKTLQEEFPQSVVCVLETEQGEGVLFDSTYGLGFQRTLLANMAGRRKTRGSGGVVMGKPGRRFKKLVGAPVDELAPRLLKAEQSNTSIVYGDRLFLKIYRKLGDGTNPDQEVLQFLTEKTDFTFVPTFAGALEYHRAKGEPLTLALGQGMVSCVSDGWAYARGVAVEFFDAVLARRFESEPPPIESLPPSTPFSASTMPPELGELFNGHFMAMVELLGIRTAQMHRALGSRDDVPEFAPESFSQLYQRSVYQSVRALVDTTFASLKRVLPGFHEPLRTEAREVLDTHNEILGFMKRMLATKLRAKRTRIHGDYHLGQVLYTAKDFVIIDFEGEPARPLGERKLKYSCFRDVAGMVRSFHYAAHAALYLTHAFRKDDQPRLERWVDTWHRCTSGLYLQAYFEQLDRSPLIPASEAERMRLLDLYVLEKAVYEVGYELNNRPDWLIVPLKGIRSIVERNIRSEEE